MGDYLVQLLCEFVFYLPFLAVLLLCAYFFNKKQGVKVPRLHIVGCFGFVFYLSAVLSITASLTLQDLIRYNFSIQGSVGLIPFSSISLFGFALNTALFVPLGFLIPLLFQGKNKLSIVAAHGFLFSLCIEASQLFKLRAADVDDLIANTLGTVLGFALYKLLLGRKDHSALWMPGQNTYTKTEPFILIAAVFILRFLIYPLIVNTLWAT
ncbi:VanZ family protein [Christensenellaceae bacterium OttesenSCG-928-K19]|nr:VanZ family protein [Christensenellaceae bacterium OttesenSCG-928-K19]